MAYAYKGLLIIPLLIITLGTYILLAGEATFKTMHTDQVNLSDNSMTGRSANRKKINIPAGAFREDLKSNRDSAFPYLLLGTGLLVVLLVLPKLGEVSFSPTYGFTLKILNEVKEAIDEAKATTQAVEVKTKKAFGANAPETFMASPADVSNEIKKLEENTAKLNAYSTLLEKMMEQKGKKR